MKRRIKFANMGKPSKKQNQPTDEQSAGNIQDDWSQASQAEQHANAANNAPVSCQPTLCIQHMERALNDMETRLATLETTCITLSNENAALKLKTDDLENRSRRNNICTKTLKLLL